MRRKRGFTYKWRHGSPIGTPARYREPSTLNQPPSTNPLHVPRFPGSPYQPEPKEPDAPQN